MGSGPSPKNHRAQDDTDGERDQSRQLQWTPGGHLLDLPSRGPKPCYHASPGRHLQHAGLHSSRSAAGRSPRHLGHASRRSDSRQIHPGSRRRRPAFQAHQLYRQRHQPVVWRDPGRSGGDLCEGAQSARHTRPPAGRGSGPDLRRPRCVGNVAAHGCR